MAKKQDQSPDVENRQGPGDPNMVGSGPVQAVNVLSDASGWDECWQYGDLTAPILVPDNAEVRVS